MGVLHRGQIKQALETTYFPHLDFAGADQSHHKLSRAVAAVAMADRSGLPAETVSKSVTDNAGDNGIDGVIYAADRATMVFVQSKWSETDKGLSSGDVLKFVHGVEQLMNID